MRENTVKWFPQDEFCYWKETIFFWCTTNLFITAGITSKGDVRPCQRVACKKFYIDGLYFIYFLSPRSAKHFTKDIALSQSLQSNGSIWQICELQHFIRQERTKKGQGVESIVFSIIYLLLKHFQWAQSESCNENCIWSKANLKDWIQFWDGTLCPDGCAVGSLCGADLCLLWRSSFSSTGTQARVRVLPVFTQSLPWCTWNLVGRGGGGALFLYLLLVKFPFSFPPLCTPNCLNLSLTFSIASLSSPLLPHIVTCLQTHNNMPS